MLEIYNEEIRDLIGKGPPAGKKHTVLHDDKKGGTQVSFLECVDCKNPGKVKVRCDLLLGCYIILLCIANIPTMTYNLSVCLETTWSTSLRGRGMSSQQDLPQLLQHVETIVSAKECRVSVCLTDISRVGNARGFL
jgi:hypothetical protein